MAIFNLGSINADYFYSVPHLPAPGETLAATAYGFGLGGKGANQSIAAAKAGAEVHHIGAVGEDGGWAVQKLKDNGVLVDGIARLAMPTGHAIINVDPDGENAIVIFSSANIAQEEGRIVAALKTAKPGDICLLQNETNLVRFTAEQAKALKMTVIYTAAPFEIEKVTEVLPYIDVLVVNDIESKQLEGELNLEISALPVPSILITHGSKGASYLSGGNRTDIASFKVNAVDTTGAGDTYLGFFAAGLDQNSPIAEAMRFAAAGAAIQVTRPGTADAIPGRKEVLAFMAENSAPA